MATKAQRHKVKLFAKICLCVLVSWWRKYFTRIFIKIITKVDLITDDQNFTAIKSFVSMLA
jgi:hypothetical protein